MASISFFEKLCKLEHLETAWGLVKQKKSAGGIDEVSVADFAKNERQELLNLLGELESETYIPHPYKEVRIPKGDKEFRVLGLPTVRDKVVQQAVKLLLEPQVEPQFLDVSYGYRPHKSAYKAVQRVKHIITAEKKYWLVNGDIDAFFDNIPHKTLIEVLGKYISCSKTLALLTLWIKMPRLSTQGTWIEPRKGIAQGNILSPLMSNLYLHALDKYMVQHKYGFVRYADDFVLLADGQKQAQKAVEELLHFVNKDLGLSLNAPPTVQRVETGFPFLGVWFNGSDITISEEKKADIHAKLQAVETQKTGQFTADYEASIESLQQYYGRLLPPSRLEAFDMLWSQAVVHHYRQRLAEDSLAKSDLSIDLWRGIHFFGEQNPKADKRGFTLWLKAIKSRKALPETILASVKDAAQEKAEIQARMAARRKEYIERMKAHKELIITGHGLFIGKAKGLLVVKKDKKNILEAPFKKIENITLLSRNFTISSEVLYQCREEKINIHYLEYSGKTVMSMMPPVAIGFKVLQAQIAAYDNGIGKTLVEKLLTGKLKNQRSVLKYFGKYEKKKQNEKDFVPFAAEIATIDNCIEAFTKVATADWAEMRGQWFAIEGRAAQAYWTGVKSLLSPYIEFVGRKRQGATDFVNMCLNYGYGFLYSRLRLLLHRKGLAENFAYLHTPSEFSEPVLTYDIIELFRSDIIDKTVIAWLRKEVLPSPLPETALSEDSAKALTELFLSRLEKIETYRADVFVMEEIMEKQVEEIRDFLMQEKSSFAPYWIKW